MPLSCMVFFNAAALSKSWMGHTGQRAKGLLSPGITVMLQALFMRLLELCRTTFEGHSIMYEKQLELSPCTRARVCVWRAMAFCDHAHARETLTYTSHTH